MVMACMAAGSLGDRLDREGSLPWREVVDLGEKMAKALGVAHGFDVLHRDVKPQNVLLSDDNEPHLADFGIARLTDAWTKPEIRLAFSVHGSPYLVRGPAREYNASSVRDRLKYRKLFRCSGWLGWGKYRKPFRHFTSDTATYRNYSLPAGSGERGAGCTVSVEVEWPMSSEGKFGTGNGMGFKCLEAPGHQGPGRKANGSNLIDTSTG